MGRENESGNTFSRVPVVSSVRSLRLGDGVEVVLPMCVVQSVKRDATADLSREDVGCNTLVFVA